MSNKHPHAQGCACPLAHLGLHRLSPLDAGPVLVGMDYAGVELRLAATIARERFDGPLLVARPPAHLPADLPDLRELVASVRPPRGRGYWKRYGHRQSYIDERDIKPDKVPEPFEVTCMDCGGRGWKQPSMVVGFHPQRCQSCGGSGKVTVR